MKFTIFSPFQLLEHKSSLKAVRACIAMMIVVALLSGRGFVDAHQSVASPIPLTRTYACRVTKNENCPGPCPTRLKRYDRTKDNPSKVAKRGEYITVHTMRNNHDGGFSRWSIVNIKDMHSKAAHSKNAFFFSCADVRPTKCHPANMRRECLFDRAQEFYKHSVRIPTSIPDGTYALGWVWYGGGGVWGSFGDYYDCFIIKIRGGPLTNTYAPSFSGAKSRTGKEGKCLATVNKIGICHREPCPGGGRYSKQVVPWEFDKGRKPDSLKKSYFKPYHSKAAGKNSPQISSMTLRSSVNPKRVYVKLFSPNKFVHMHLTNNMLLTVTCEARGRVKAVAFFIQGVPARKDFDEPFTIAGDWKNEWKKTQHYAPWKYNVSDKVMSISCKAFGYDDTVDWFSASISTFF